MRDEKSLVPDDDQVVSNEHFSSGDYQSPPVLVLRWVSGTDSESLLLIGHLPPPWIDNKGTFIAFGIKLLLFIVALLATAFAQITNIEDCKCNSGFEAKLSQDLGEPNLSYRCHGILPRIVARCNEVTKPKCICTEELLKYLTENETSSSHTSTPGDCPGENY
ncbi:hypothetical protein JTB14_020856 [Gonioctena quinquepunctata]|nr:hypothetical protein JTB14_020856 [Gonioctena quinquepunctata]